jgi:hypothetical protein
MSEAAMLFGAYLLGFVFGACVTALLRSNDERQD